MTFLNDKEENIRLKKLVYKYAVAMIVLVINHIISPFIFAGIYSVFFPSDNLYLDGDGLFLGIMLLNALAAYLFPIPILKRLFAAELKERAEPQSFKRIPCEPLLLYLSGVAVGSLGTLITRIISAVLDKLFGTGELEKAFSSGSPITLTQFIIFVFFICIVAPICEEYIFRVILLEPLKKYSCLAAILVNGVIFGLYHANFDQFAYSMVLGAVYSMIVVRSGSVRPVVFLHALNNLIVSLGSYFPKDIPGAESIIGISGVISNLMLPLGIISVIILSITKSFNFGKGNFRETMGEILRSPAIWIATVVMLLMFFR